MDEKTSTIVAEMTRASDQERITFPQAVAALMGAGVERYHMDLVRNARTFYMPDGASETVPTHQSPEPALDFSAQEVEAAVRGIQQGEFQYLEFCRRIALAGCVGYQVFIRGRRVIYYGRNGDLQIEHFPGART